MGLPLLALLAAPGWQVELDVTETFDNVQPGGIHAFHVAHFTLELDVDGPPPRDGHVRIATDRALAREVAGRIDGSRDTPHGRSEYTATLATRRATLALAYDDPRNWALSFALPLATRGTNVACTAAGSCADGAIAAVSPLGWTLSAASGAQITTDGTTWYVDYVHDDEAAPGATRRHRALHLVLRPQR